MTSNMNSKTKATFMLMKLDPPPKQNIKGGQRNNADHEIGNYRKVYVNELDPPPPPKRKNKQGNKGTTSDMNSSKDATLILMKLDPFPSQNNINKQRNNIEHEIENESNVYVNDIGPPSPKTTTQTKTT